MRLFFGGTTMGGRIKGKPVVYDIMEFENRQLYYLINNTLYEILMQHMGSVLGKSRLETFFIKIKNFVVL